MGKQTSVLKVEGNLDGVSFYKRKGVNLVRKSSGPKKSTIMTHPRYERTRQNLNEFKGIARAIATFAAALAAVKKIAGGEFRATIGRVLRTIMKLSTEARGWRPVMISQHRDLLRHVDLSSDTLISLMAVNVTATHSAARNSGSITTQRFTPAHKVAMPPKATHFQLVHLIAAVSDTVFNKTTSQYEISDPIVLGLNDAKFSDYYDVRGTADVQIVLDCALPDAPVLPNNVTVVQCVGIVYSELSGTTYYPMYSPTAMKIVDVF